VIRPVTLRGVVALGVAILAGAAPAGAQVDVPCARTGQDTATVTISQPAEGSTVSGRVVVTGEVAGLPALSQVELFVGEARTDVQSFAPPLASGTFSLTWDAAGAQAGPARLRVVTCGGSPTAGSAVWGAGAAVVVVEPPAGSTVALPPLVPDRGRQPGRWVVWVGAAFGLSALVGLLTAMRRPGRHRGR
jgi:hypothetical protein